MDLLHVLLNVIIMLSLIYGIVWMKKKKRYSFTVRVFTALILGILYGVILQYAYGATSTIVKEANTWFVLVGNGYVRLLKMTVIPLIFVAITSAIINQDSKNLGKKAGTIIAILLITAGIAAAVGAGTAGTFGLDASSIQVGMQETQAGEKMVSTLADFQQKTIQDQFLEIIPTNPFYALTGQGSNATLSVVFFAALVGIATVGLRKTKPESAELFTKFLNAFHDVVMRIVTLVLRLTPYGVLALMTKFVSTSNVSEILRLLQFVLASYTAILIMFGIHLIILAVFGLNPNTYLKKTVHVLTFAFTSRTSAGTLPLTVEALTDRLGVSNGVANLSASFGTSIGQNGCAGIYPAMLAVMIAPAVGIDPMTPAFLFKLVIVVALGSFGIAGVGGGATFAALTVLSIMGLPVGLVGLLIAIEPLIDMARTALNVSDSMVTGLVSSKVLHELDKDKYNDRNAGSSTGDTALEF
ncbi:L-cystine transporter [Desulfitobacterium metallireducens]|uniref:L-cystine uptake protein TcyP n=1 Tax=Desulfitobacterium metallireducens DSM 15288 TaxID=871968 RepID=W0E656_9FIRM|nr:cation:dicarboxylase symporter family transporter [Desulfitobacterium metallireducens]AHF06355.1 L-cystine transporter tcyP [Desulfitobacterium metallireducens DSM 15288]